MPRRRRLVLAWLVVLAVAGCAGGASPPSPSQGAGSSGGPTPGAIDHPTGSADVVLRLEEGGGLMPVDLSVASAPIFTLYGDGTVLLRPTLVDPPPNEGSIIRGQPFRTARLSEDQIDGLLEFALNRGGLGVARAKYDPGTIADGTTSTFTIRAGEIDKRVDVVALGPDHHPPADAPTMVSLAALADRLRDFDQGGTVRMDAWTPDRYRGVVWEAGAGGGDARPWPWSQIAPEDFVRPDAGTGFGFPHRVMTREEVGRLGLANVEGGISGLLLAGPDGTVHAFALRPLLPDEAE